MCQSSVLEIVTDVVPLYDIICLRVLSFIKQCLSSESDVVRYVTSYGLQYGRMSSVHGKNIQFCCERFVRNQNDLLGKSFDKRHVYAACLNRRDTESYCRAACVLELLMVTYYTFQMTFSTIDLKISTTCCILFVLAGVSLVIRVFVYSVFILCSLCSLCVFIYFLHSCIYLFVRFEHDFCNRPNNKFNDVSISVLGFICVRLTRCNKSYLLTYLYQRLKNVTTHV